MQQMMVKLYELYEETCRRSGVVDFAELLLRAFELLQGNSSLLAHYRARFTQVLVDEFQDTNAIQYAWVKLIAGPGRQPASWWATTTSPSTAGAARRWRTCRQFTRDYPKAQMFRLEQNYRSTGNILGAANALIENNSGRLGKNLWTSGGKGEQHPAVCGVQ